MSTRSGIGWDSHRLVAGRSLIIGGVALEHPEGLGLQGHSDADVLTHALMDAILGAAGLGDIGQHFPDSDGAYEGADSVALLGEVVASARAAGWVVTHADMTLVMERPKLRDARAAIRTRLAQALGVAEDAVNVKASTGEGIGFVGREEGVAALAVVTVAPA
ncbi:MAG TPA: 2-C-methyl-D-erythritol 2,4-cyclodiphosphate synthase [Solirubrobacteraceae bacterium]